MKKTEEEVVGCEYVIESDIKIAGVCVDDVGDYVRWRIKMDGRPRIARREAKEKNKTFIY